MHHGWPNRCWKRLCWSISLQNSAGWISTRDFSLVLQPNNAFWVPRLERFHRFLFYSDGLDGSGVVIEYGDCWKCSGLPIAYWSVINGFVGDITTLVQIHAIKRPDNKSSKQFGCPGPPSFPKSPFQPKHETSGRQGAYLGWNLQFYGDKTVTVRCGKLWMCAGRSTNQKTLF